MTAGLSTTARELTPDEVSIFYADPERLAESARDLCDQWASGALPTIDTGELMDQWTRYLHRDHSVLELEEWARRLSWFRFCRAVGGHANDGDQLLVALRYVDPNDLDGLWISLGGSRPSSNIIDIRGIRVGVLQLRDRVLLSLSGADGDPFQVTLKDVQNAEVVEQSLSVARPRVVDPPVDDHHCVAPKFYPELWISPRD
jgi:hypothetical protein